MTSQNKSPAALRKTALVFASLCCSATAVGAAAPLFISSSDTSVTGTRSVAIGAVAAAHAASDTSKVSKDA